MSNQVSIEDHFRLDPEAAKRFAEAMKRSDATIERLRQATAETARYVANRKPEKKYVKMAVFGRKLGPTGGQNP